MNSSSLPDLVDRRQRKTRLPGYNKEAPRRQKSQRSPSTTIIICAIGIALPYTWFGENLGLTTLPHSYWFIVAGMLLTYATLTHLVKTWFIQKWGM
jgi:hypothetical protein